MLLKLILIICLLVSVSFSINVDSHAAQFTNSPIISGSSGNTGANPCYHDDEDITRDPAQFTQGPVSSGSGSGSGNNCPRHHRKDAKSGGAKDTSKEQKINNLGRDSSGSGSSGSGCGATGSTGTGSGRSATTVNDGVTYKASNVKGGEQFDSTSSSSGNNCGEITGW